MYLMMSTLEQFQVEQIVEMIEEKEKLNRSIDSEANSSLNRSMEAEVKREAVVSPAKEVVEVGNKGWGIVGDDGRRKRSRTEAVGCMNTMAAMETAIEAKHLDDFFEHVSDQFKMTNVKKCEF